MQPNFWPSVRTGAKHLNQFRAVDSSVGWETHARLCMCSPRVEVAPKADDATVILAEAEYTAKMESEQVINDEYNKRERKKGKKQLKLGGLSGTKLDLQGPGDSC